MNLMTDQELLDWCRFVATKFARNVEGWTYTRNKHDLVHIRYKSDYTGYNHWTKRLKRAMRHWNPVRYFKPRSPLDRAFAERKRTLRGYLSRAVIWSWSTLQKEDNLPDGTVNGIITHWEEDGEYIMLMGPTVGVKVLDFIAAEPENPHAKAIVAEMRRVAEMSQDEEKDND